MPNLGLKPLPRVTEQSKRENDELFDAYESDCRIFCREVLGYDAWGTQEDIMAAISKPRARVAVKACHSSGKTSVAARILLWFTYTGGICISTAPTWTQVEQLLWQEVHEAHDDSAFELAGNLLQTHLRVDIGAYAFGISTNEGVKFQGFHARQGSKMLIILDEAPGVKPMIWEAIEGIRAGGDVRLLCLGNPVINSGPFYNAFNKDKSIWQTFTIDALDTPNIRGLTEADILAMSDEELDDNPREYLTTRRWVKEKYVQWGPNSPIYQARVRGRFPDQSDDSLISLVWLEEARMRNNPDGYSDRIVGGHYDLPEPPETLEWWAGVDVAGPGESETVVTIRHGDVIKAQHVFYGDATERVAAVLAPYQIWGIRVNVDCIGIGWYFAQYLKKAGFQVYFVNVGVGALDKTTYYNCRAETYWALRDRFKAGRVGGLTDDTTIEQLAGLRYEQTDKNLIKLEPKKEAVKRGVPSPDRAESVMLAFHDPSNYEIEADEELSKDLEEYVGW